MSKLAEPFGAAPKHGGQYVLFVNRRGDVDGTHSMVTIFAAPYAAKKFMECLLRDDEVCWAEDEGRQLRSSSGILIEAHSSARFNLREVWEHEYTLQEMAWRLPSPYPESAARWRLVSDPAYVVPQVEVERRERAKGVPRASRAGLTSIGEICEELDILPRDARGALRKAKIQKPACGWAWKPEEVEKVKELIRKAVK